jgi:hypothetical protein
MLPAACRRRSGLCARWSDIGSITIKGSLLGSVSLDGDPADGDFTAAVISARGQDLGFAAKNDIAIKSIKIGGRVKQAPILTGYDTALAAKNADAQTGPIVSAVA